MRAEAFHLVPQVYLPTTLEACSPKRSARLEAAQPGEAKQVSEAADVPRGYRLGSGPRVL
ncbi:hypothetical protein AS9A_2918 [Hoyosella subflava DQS3-9A1]|uniref:Uncharacterized protein n=1 Tax=Hoyosella subflava (strain DSM 45089 / JCM 17490 / NBRC 109087 / DQS3-9A1) TaxID=443218 RepID=F6EK08_HOYSD|nr:hypothetical protein AS9A_2918 [Hoyosella subflava DQS3-9A1]